MRGLMPRFRLLAMMLVLVVVSIGRARGDTVRYATISDGGNSTLGALDLTTGRFTAIASLSQLIIGMTAGPDNTLYAGALFSGNVYTIGPTGTLTQFGSVPRRYRREGPSSASGASPTPARMDSTG